MKRLISVVLVILLFGISALPVLAYKDEQDIDNLEAVTFLSQHGIISGYDDDSFKPYEVISRAQMSKLLFNVLNRSEKASSYVDYSTELTDIKGNWAEGYIKYCFSAGIINGYSNGTFQPDATVSGVAAAKMLLSALGYIPRLEGYIGEDWQSKVISDAEELGLLDGYDGDIYQDCTRDNAAQLIYNALFIPMVQKYEGNNAVTEVEGQDGLDNVQMLIVTSIGAQKITGVVTGNEQAVLVGQDNYPLAEGKTQILSDGKEYICPFSSQLSDLGKSVTVYVNPETMKLYSEPIYLDENSSITVSERLSPIDLYEKLESWGLSVPTDGSALFSLDYGLAQAQLAYETFMSTDLGGAGTVSGMPITYCDNNGDGQVDYIFAVRPKISVVTEISVKDKTTVLNNSLVLSWSRCEGEEAVAQGDYVIVISTGYLSIISAAKSVTGTVTQKTENLGNTYIDIDGVMFEQSYAAAYSDRSTITFDGTNLIYPSDMNLGQKYTIYLDQYGYMAAAELNSGISQEYALAYSAYTKPSSTAFNSLDYYVVACTEKGVAEYRLDKAALSDSALISALFDTDSVRYPGIFCTCSIRGGVIKLSLVSDEYTQVYKPKGVSFSKSVARMRLGDADVFANNSTRFYYIDRAEPYNSNVVTGIGSASGGNVSALVYDSATKIVEAVYVLQQ